MFDDLPGRFKPNRRTAGEVDALVELKRTSSPNSESLKHERRLRSLYGAATKRSQVGENPDLGGFSY